LFKFDPKFNLEAIQMNTLVSHLTTTFVDDAIELVKGFGKAIVRIATAPIERMATFCDVGGVLPRRPAPPYYARGLRRLSPFASLHHLT
jgi:hypothetical protein